MEEKFIAAWMQNRERAAAFGARMRPIDPASALKTAHFLLGGSRLSDGFDALARAGHLELSLEALAVDKRFTQLFSDEEANNALSRLLEAGYRFRYAVRRCLPEKALWVCQETAKNCHCEGGLRLPPQ